nr:immunoglobulin light chain junction region [Macaca mulatta]
CQQHNSFPPSF